MNKTKIEWCDATWNPVTGCFHGCQYCYARRIANRFAEQDVKDQFLFKGDPRLHVLEDKIYVERNRNRKLASAYPFGFEPTLYRYRMEEYLNRSGRTIFVCSMADLFGEWVPDEWIEEVFDACKKAYQHRYLFLTKNPRRYIKLAEQGKLLQTSNVWYGSTTSSPDDPLFYSDGFQTFASIEPILEDFTDSIQNQMSKYVDWVIIGAETGNRKEKVIPEISWIDYLVKYCEAEKIPIFMKDSLLPIIGEKNMRREFPWRKM